MRWESAAQSQVNWANILQADSYHVWFLIQVIYYSLASPANLHIWIKIETPACPLCSERVSLEHILSTCPKALNEGYFRWQHDQVLKAVAEIIASGTNAVGEQHWSLNNIDFVEAGEKLFSQP